MTDTSLPPPPVKSNAPMWIGVVVVLLAGAGAAVLLRSGSDADKAQAPAAAVTPVEQPKAPPPPPPPPPPPEPEPEASVTVQPTTKHDKPATTAPQGPVGPEGCGGTCNGKADGQLKAALAQVGASARSCYNNALRNNSTLSGKLTVSLRVAPNGSACGARASVDTLHEASVTSCILQKFRSAKYPKPSGGCVDGEVPINLVAPK